LLSIKSFSHLHKGLVLSDHFATRSAVSSYSRHFSLKNTQEVRKHRGEEASASKKLLQSSQVTFTHFHAVAPVPYKFLSSAFSSRINWTLKTQKE